MRPCLFATFTLCALTCACSSEIKDVQTFNFSGSDLRGGMIRYDASPPAGGPYSPLWQNCGVYAAAVYPEYAVHSLARGAVWLTYRPELSAEEVQRLKDALKEKPASLLSPLPGQREAVVASVWNAQLRLSDPADSRLKRFIDKYAGASTVPEPGAPCSGGYSGTM